MFISIYLFDLRNSGFEAGGKIWWNSYRPIHGVLYLLYSIYAFKGDTNAWYVLLTDVFIGFKRGKDVEGIISYINSKNKYEINIVENNTFYDQENPAEYLDYLQKLNIKYQVVSLDAFSSNKKPSILLGSLYLIGEYKKRKLL